MRMLLLIPLFILSTSCHSLSPNSASVKSAANDSAPLFQIVEDGEYNSPDCRMLVSHTSNATYITLVSGGEKVVTSFNNRLSVHVRYDLSVEANQYQTRRAVYSGAVVSGEDMYDQAREFTVQDEHHQDTIGVSINISSTKCKRTADADRCSDSKNKPAKSASLECAGLKLIGS